MTASDHDRLSLLLGPAALGLLTEPEQRALDRHLTTCPSCRAELADLTGVVGRLGDLEGQELLLHDTADDGARADAVVAALGRARLRERRTSRWTQVALAAAASVAVLAAGLVSAAALNRETASPVPLEPVAVAGPAGVTARADLIAHTWGVEIRLVAAGLGDGRPYDVVVTTESGRRVQAGAFLGTGERTLLCNLNAAVLREDAASFAVVDSAGRQVLSADL